MFGRRRRQRFRWRKKNSGGRLVFRPFRISPTVLPAIAPRRSVSVRRNRTLVIDCRPMMLCPANLLRRTAAAQPKSRTNFHPICVACFSLSARPATASVPRFLPPNDLDFLSGLWLFSPQTPRSTSVCCAKRTTFRMLRPAPLPVGVLAVPGPRRRMPRQSWWRHFVPATSAVLAAIVDSTRLHLQACGLPSHLRLHATYSPRGKSNCCKFKQPGCHRTDKLALETG